MSRSPHRMGRVERITDFGAFIASVDRANPAIDRHRKTGHFVAVIETEEFYCEAVS